MQDKEALICAGRNEIHTFLLSYPFVHCKCQLQLGLIGTYQPCSASIPLDQSAPSCHTYMQSHKSGNAPFLWMLLSSHHTSTHTFVLLHNCSGTHWDPLLMSCCTLGSAICTLQEVRRWHTESVLSPQYEWVWALVQQWWRSCTSQQFGSCRQWPTCQSWQLFSIIHWSHRIQPAGDVIIAITLKLKLSLSRVVEVDTTNCAYEQIRTASSIPPTFWHLHIQTYQRLCPFLIDRNAVGRWHCLLLDWWRKWNCDLQNKWRATTKTMDPKVRFESYPRHKKSEIQHGPTNQLRFHIFLSFMERFYDNIVAKEQTCSKRCPTLYEHAN